jgi:hypothetical protein
MYNLRVIHNNTVLSTVTNGISRKYNSKNISIDDFAMAAK